MNAIQEAVKNEDVFFLTKFLFNVELTKGQEDIVRKISFLKHQRIGISAMTRYGKTFCVAIGVCLLILFNKNKKIAFIGPQKEQAELMREYVSKLIYECKILRDLADIEYNNKERLKKEASKKRMTFKNGCEYRIGSAEGKAYRLMGFGADVVILDEAGLISIEAYTKITRMLGDDPENSVLIELMNPWLKDGKAYDHWHSGIFKTIHIDYHQAIKEGRVTKKFVEEQRHELRHDPIAFTVLYESKFPEDMEDSLIRWEWIENAVNRDLTDRVKDGQKVVGLDIAEMGMDLTVLTRGLEKDNNYQVYDIKWWGKKDTEETYEKVKPIIDKEKEITKIDATGVGSGVYNRFKHQKYNVREFKSGRSPENEKDRDKYLNIKAQGYWQLRVMFEEGRIQIPDNAILKEQLNKMRFGRTSANKIKIIDPEEKSPDYADSLMMMCAQGKAPIAFGFA